MYPLKTNVGILDIGLHLDQIELEKLKKINCSEYETKGAWPHCMYVY